ncbi:MAG: 2,3-bisphosphoglycerate-independent phosphoglycerate mutase [Bacillota bacterium]
MKNPVALLILDGWGINTDSNHNAINAANTPNFDKLSNKYATTTIKASGEDVGLPKGQMGNSEVGHLNIGAGRVVYQDLTRISKDIENDDFSEKKVLKEACQNVKKNDTSLHIMGLLSDGGVHSHIKHVKGLVKMAKKNGVKRLYLHAFLDGRDTPPKSAAKYIKEIEAYMDKKEVGNIATISGRYYAMDRDNNWDRTKLAYDAIVHGEGLKADNALEALENSYDDGANDEFVKPTVILENDKPVGTLDEDDSVIFFNFRPDRARQLTRAISDKEFKEFEKEYFETDYVCMTTYDETFENVDIAYETLEVKNTLGQYLSDKGKTQLRIAETEKYAHVTFFFNGGIEKPNEGEERILIKSPGVSTYDKKPEMSAYKVKDELLKQIDLEKHDFIVLNFANPDMVGHTGDFDATVKAIETVDECLGEVVDKLKSKNGEMIITADHGNAELMEDADGNPMTAHTSNIVPCIVVGNRDYKLRDDGALCDLAPTLLEFLELDKPEEMTGKSLIKK